MDTFLMTKFTIPPGYGMGAYSLGHFLWLAAIISATVAVAAKYKEMDGRHRRYLLYVLASAALLDELYKDIVPIVTGQWNWGFLPLHICSISIFVIMIHAITHSVRAAEFLYAVSLPTAVMALVFPNWTSSLPFWNYESIHSFSIHGLIVIYPAILLYGGFRPCARRLLPVSAIFLALSGIASLANHFLGHVHANDMPSLPDLLACLKYVEAASTAEIQHNLSFTKGSYGDRIAAGKPHVGPFGKPVQGFGVIAHRLSQTEGIVLAAALARTAAGMIARGNGRVVGANKLPDLFVCTLSFRMRRIRSGVGRWCRMHGTSSSMVVGRGRSKRQKAGIHAACRTICLTLARVSRAAFGSQVANDIQHQGNIGAVSCVAAFPFHAGQAAVDKCF